MPGKIFDIDNDFFQTLMMFKFSSTACSCTLVANFFLFPLHDLQIIPAQCKYEVLLTKIEIRLAKAEALQWTSLEFSMDAMVPQSIIVSSGGLTCLCH